MRGMTGESRLLAILVKRELKDARWAVERACKAKAKGLESRDDMYWDSAAFNIQVFYTAAEKIMQRIAEELDGFLPHGKEWHKDLIVQMASGIGIRPPVLSEDTADMLDELRAFRHATRNIYPFKLDTFRVAEMCVLAEKCLELFEADLERFIETAEEGNR